MKRGTTVLGLLVLVLCGCQDATSPPKALSQLLSTADRIEATNHWYAFGNSIAGAEVREITRAIASAKKNTVGKPHDWTHPYPRVWDFEFHAGTNQLAIIRTAWGVFEIASVEYRDGTGTLLASWKKLEEQLQAHR